MHWINNTISCYCHKTRIENNFSNEVVTITDWEERRQCRGREEGESQLLRWIRKKPKTNEQNYYNKNLIFPDLLSEQFLQILSFSYDISRYIFFGQT